MNNMLKNYVVKINYGTTVINNQLYATKEIEAAKKVGNEFNTNKFFYVSNANTHGVTHPIFQEMFTATARKMPTGDITESEALEFEVVSIRIPGSIKNKINNAELLRGTFTWAGMTFKNAAFVIEPGKRYILPKNSIAIIERFLASKNLDPTELGLATDKTGVIQFTAEDGQKVDVEEYDLSQFKD